MLNWKKMMSHNEVVEFEVTRLIKETEQAWLLEIDDNDVWIPKSLMKEGSDDLDIDIERTYTIVIPQWLAEQKELV